MGKIFTLFLLLLCGFCYGAEEYIDSNGRSFNYSKNIPYRAVQTVLFDEDLTSITLDDGSMWQTKDYPSCMEAKKWAVNDAILIYPSRNGLGKERYSLYNGRLRSFSHVDLIAGSNSSYPTRLSISDIDAGLITLQNHSGKQFHFAISPKTSEDWDQGDGIIMGWNKDMWPGNDLKFPYILINTSKKTFIRTNYLKDL